MFRVTRVACAAAFVAGLTSTAFAQATAPQTVPERRWSVDFGIGWDRGISGNITSGAIGSLNGVSTVIVRNQYEDVYGTGLHIRFGGGYMIREDVELRATFTLQSLDADLVRLGDYGASNLYGQFDDYQSMSLDIGYRQYLRFHERILGYGEGTVGLAFVDETDVLLAAPEANLVGTATDFYDRTAAFALAINVGALYEARDRVDVFAQFGIRYVTGMTDVDNLEGTGLETINNKSARWAIPLTFGVRVRF